MTWLYMLGAFLSGFILGGYIFWKKGRNWQKKLDHRKLRDVYYDIGKLIK